MPPVISPEVAARLRETPPVDHATIPGSLPVISFGDFTTARVATVSLNPSDKEFLDGKGRFLTGPKRRLESLKSLGATEAGSLSDEQLERVMSTSNQYFQTNPLTQWFRHIENVLVRSGVASYYDGTACHLDLVQWATKPKQGELSGPVWQTLVDRDKEFLRWQLDHSNITIVLVNGAGVLRQLEWSKIIGPVEVDSFTFAGISRQRTMKVFRATSGSTAVLGWNLALAQGVAEDGLTKLATWLKEQIRS